MKTVLCIIDMQPEFSIADKVINEVKKQIWLAKRRDGYVIVIEYSGAGQTLSDLQKELKKLKPGKVFHTKKRNDDGSREIVKLAKTHSLDIRRLRVCGVNRCFCVYETVCSLSSNNDITVEVPFEATACDCGMTVHKEKSCLIRAGAMLI